MLLDLLKPTIQQTKIMFGYTTLDRTPAGNRVASLEKYSKTTDYNLSRPGGPLYTVYSPSHFYVALF